LSDHQTLSSRALFERSQLPKPDEMARVPIFEVVWHRWMFPHLSSLSAPKFSHQPFKKNKEQPFNLLALQIWFIFFLL
jgi:hypothetical protein